MAGAAQVVLVGASGASGASVAQIVSRWALNGTGDDAEGRSNGVLTDAELGVDPLLDDGGSSVGLNGISSKIQAADVDDWRLLDYSVVAYFQLDTAPAVDMHYNILCKDAGTPPGGFSIEARNVGGVVRVRAYTRDHASSFFWINNNPDGVKPLELDTGYRVVLTVGGGGTALYVNDDLVGTTNITQGLQANASIFSIGTYPPAFSPFDGVIDEVRLYRGVLSLEEVRALPAARTIDHAGVKLLGSWSFAETSGNSFADAVAGNDATLTVPAWTVATHEHDRRGIAVGTDHALEVSNGGPAISMAAGYKNADTSLVVYVCPLGELRGVQFWDSADERYGREVIAECDDGSTPGSFALYRRWASTTEWRLGGYVRDGGGSKQYFGALAGVSGATLPIDTAKRIVLTQGPAGAALYLDDSQVATLPSVTQGWASLSADITLGSSSNTGHANDRSPLWGRLDEIAVWDGQLDLTAVQALAAASDSLLWRAPADFVGAGTDINVADYPGNLQGAMDAAHSAGVYLYQDEGDATVYTQALNAYDNMIEFRPGCKGLLGLRLRMPFTNGRRFARIVMMDVLNQMGGHNDRYVANGGYKFLGCVFDGNGRGQNWHPKSGEPGYTYHAFDLEQEHAIFARSNGGQGNMTIRVDACSFYDGTGDALSLDTITVTTATSNRFYGYFRGSHVVNGTPQTLNAQRFESFNRNGFGGPLNGCGLQDIEAFSGAGSTALLTFRDGWAESDFDDENEGTASNNSFSHYVNCHMLAAALYIGPSGNANNLPTQDWTALYCTFSYHKHFFNYPPAWWKGFPGGDNGYGCLFDHCVFLANGTPYQYHNNYTLTPVNTDVFAIYYENAGGANQGPRLWTMRACEWRPNNLPGGTPTANVRCIAHTTMTTAQSVELDGVVIDGAFADLPFDMGATTVRYRNVLHERTGNPKPWTNAGAEVPF